VTGLGLYERGMGNCDYCMFLGIWKWNCDREPKFLLNGLGERI